MHSGCITFASAQKTRETVKSVPLDRILLETDGPWMAPVPYRGQAAHPGMIPVIANTVAQLHGTTTEKVLQQATKNTQKMYRLK